MPVKTIYNTKIREFILSQLDGCDTPLSSLELWLSAKEKGLECDRSTIYRQLEKLTETGEIREIDFLEGKKRYEINLGHHHHFVCEKCQKIMCLHLDEKYLHKLSDSLQNDYGVKISRHLVEFFGTCSECRV